MESITINGRTFTECLPNPLLNKKVAFKNDAKLIPEEFVVFDTFYDHMGIEFCRLHNLQTGHKNQVGLPHTLRVI